MMTMDMNGMSLSVESLGCNVANSSTASADNSDKTSPSPMMMPDMASMFTSPSSSSNETCGKMLTYADVASSGAKMFICQCCEDTCNIQRRCGVNWDLEISSIE